MKEQELIDIRAQIDSIDRKIIQLLSKRMEIAIKTKRYKERIFDPEREQMVLKNVKKYSGHLVRPEFSETLYRQIIEESRAIQEMDLKLMGFQGEHGAYSEEAILTHTPSFIPVPYMEFKDVFEDVEAGIIDRGLVPIENSIEGAVTSVNDLLIEKNLFIVGEIIMPIHHCLLGLPDTDFSGIKVVYSHPQALAQCRSFISRYKLEPRPYYDTAGAARMLSEERLEGACVIANRLCTELYGLKIIKENIEDHPSNSTRFIILSKEPIDGDGEKSSIIFSVRHEVGALFKVLKVFFEASINLTRIESRPAKDSPGKYIFFTDFEGTQMDKRIVHVLEAIQNITTSFKFLGSYKTIKRGV